MRTAKLNAATLVAVTLLSLCSSVARAADPAVEALLAKMRQAYSQTKSVTFTTEGLFGEREFLTKTSYVSPNKLRVSLTLEKMPKAGVLLVRICNGQTISTKELNQPFKNAKFSMDALGADLPVNLESISFFDWDRQLSTAPGKNMAHSTFKLEPHETWNAKDWIVLQETATDNKVVCSYYIDPKTYFIWRTVVKAMPGGRKQDEMDCRIKELNLNAPIDPSTFEIVVL